MPKLLKTEGLFSQYFKLSRKFVPVETNDVNFGVVRQGTLYFFSQLVPIAL